MALLELLIQVAVVVAVLGNLAVAEQAVQA
jgi:hypothetical protein